MDPNPRDTMEYMVALNDKWALVEEIQTPTIIGWVLGKFDRGWTERPSMVRYAA